MEFYQWLIDEKGLSSATASKYNLVIKNRISEWMPSYVIPKNSIEFEALKQTIYELDIYQERNRVGNNMYSSALNHYGNYLRTFDYRDREIFKENKEFTSEAKKLIKVRLVQNKFRKGLFDLNKTCAVTGFNNVQFLIASHIKPWAVSTELERVDSYNGLLLTPNYDRLFDRGFISFRLNGEIIVSKKLKKDEEEFFNIPQNLCIQLSSNHKAYLEYHSEMIFKK